MGDGSFKRFFNEVLNNLKTHMKDGLPALGIPPLDPLNAGNFSFKEETSYVKCKASFQDIVVTGLSSITFPKIAFNGDHFELAITANLKDIKAAGKYNLKYCSVCCPSDRGWWSLC